MKKEIKNIMIFGDSYSTFAGYIPEGYAVYYSEKDRPETDVRKVSETWWYSLSEDMGYNVVLNDSWSGSTLCYTGYNGDCSKTSSFICRLEKLIEADFFKKNEIDTVLIFGCTNDSWANSPLGEVQFSDFTHEDLFSVCPAICYFIKRLKDVLPDANVISLINTGLKPEIGAAFKSAAEHYGTEYIELCDIDKRCSHPTVKGMADICEQVKKYISERGV